jgi:hypothetical protein
VDQAPEVQNTRKRRDQSRKPDPSALFFGYGRLRLHVISCSTILSVQVDGDSATPAATVNNPLVKIVEKTGRRIGHTSIQSDNLHKAIQPGAEQASCTLDNVTSFGTNSFGCDRCRKLVWLWHSCIRRPVTLVAESKHGESNNRADTQHTSDNSGRPQRRLAACFRQTGRLVPISNRPWHL